MYLSMHVHVQIFMQERHVAQRERLFAAQEQAEATTERLMQQAEATTQRLMQQAEAVSQRRERQAEKVSQRRERHAEERARDRIADMRETLYAFRSGSHMYM